MTTPDKPKTLEGSEFRSSEGRGRNLSENQSSTDDGAEDVFTVATSVGSPEELAGIGRRIAALRLRAGLTQDVLSQRVLVSLTAVKAWEAGRSLPRLEQAVKLADCLGVSLDTLVHGGDQAAEPPPAPSMDQVDEANLIWALDFAERQAGREVDVEKRIDLMIFAASEFRRTQRMPPLPPLDQQLLAGSLRFVEFVAESRGETPDTAHRVRAMLASYAASLAWIADMKSQVKPTS